MDNLQLESAEYDLISSPNNGVCLFKSGADRNLLDVHAPPHKHALITGAEDNGRSSLVLKLLHLFSPMKRAGRPWGGC